MNCRKLVATSSKNSDHKREIISMLFSSIRIKSFNILLRNNVSRYNHGDCEKSCHVMKMNHVWPLSIWKVLKLLSIDTIFMLLQQIIFFFISLARSYCFVFVWSGAVIKQTQNIHKAIEWVTALEIDLNNLTLLNLRQVIVSLRENAFLLDPSAEIYDMTFVCRLLAY